MPTTTNYGWTTPADTDLVKDGASAIRTLGNGVDTSLKALNPETTLGDISYRSSTANTNTRLAIGTTGQVLTVSGGVPAWQTVSAGGMTQLATGTLSGSSVVLSSISGSYKDLMLIIRGLRPSTDGEYTKMRLNGDTGVKYNGNTTAQIDGFDPNSNDFLQLDRMPDNTVTTAFHSIIFSDYTNTSTIKTGKLFAIVPDMTTPTLFNYTNRTLVYNSTSAISSITLFPSAGNWAGGTYILYGVA